MIRRAAGWALGLVLILFIGLMTLQPFSYQRQRIP